MFETFEVIAMFVNDVKNLELIRDFQRQQTDQSEAGLHNAK
jgi:hypothetical protein